MLPDQALSAFDQFLVTEGLRFEPVVMGGAALALLGITTRQTRDCDVLVPVLPEETDRAAREFAHQQNTAGVDLAVAAELAELQPWVALQDANPDWPAHVRATLADLARRLGHAV